MNKELLKEATEWLKALEKKSYAAQSEVARLITRLEAELAKPEQHVLSNDVVRFLNGEIPLDGVWFGDKHPTLKGNYWWRSFLKNIDAIQTAPSELAKTSTRPTDDALWDQTLRERDDAQDLISQIAAYLGCDEEWSSSHSHFDCIRSYIASSSSAPYVPDWSLKPQGAIGFVGCWSSFTEDRFNFIPGEFYIPAPEPSDEELNTKLLAMSREQKLKALEINGGEG